ncbi:hypothetical protein [Microbacterium sp. SORGH_AS_0862]|uniref:hypothetical protein n=1 Tax=Microbacterium sp. SORGH_AS_0862 TaxID=3041789 RepID=UPI002793FF10|nr:hypothetical protein [Microbacterium sp. SORGH_AS_0862]MDQ1206485.1 hypothetical protein [Microbacterium sp. SORGH_AS_0862]
MKRKLLFSTVALALVALSGCAATPAPAPSVPTGIAGSTTTATPTPEPEPARLVIGIQAIGYEHDGQTQVVSYSEPVDLQILLRSISDEDPIQTPIDDLPGYNLQLQRFDYDGIVVVSGPDGPAHVAVTTASFHGVPVATQEGIAVGSSRTEAMDAGARDGFDQDGDGVADWLDLGSVEISGTQSLTNPGSVGIQFVRLGLDGDTVRELQAPADDFSDL